jgi:hypothetical protein
VLVVAREGARAVQLELIARERTAWTTLWRSDAQVCAPAR